MRIYSMTATFGKLENQTLTLKPGLNILHAPNEWGKSTWCAFLVAMLYGIATREHSTKAALADKERYAPWSGSPMAGRMDLNWNGRDITIERSSKGRTPLGVFRAYETKTGLDVPELTAENCGQLLLGVEKSVFTRSGFLKLSDLPVTQDEHLRKRLNALVTTGDESGTADTLAQKLSELKNKCYVNRSKGLLPQVTAQREELQSKLTQLNELQAQCARLQQQQEALDQQHRLLKNHEAALVYQTDRTRVEKLADARAAQAIASVRLSQLETQCKELPENTVLQENLMQLQTLRATQDDLRTQAQLCLHAPAAPEVHRVFQGVTPEAALAQARKDTLTYTTAAKKRDSKHMPVLGIAALLLGMILLFLPALPVKLVGGAAGIAGTIVLILGLVSRRTGSSTVNQLLHIYAPLQPEQWVAAAEQALDAHNRYLTDCQNYQAMQQQLQQKHQALEQQLAQLTQGLPYLQCQQQWQQALDDRKALEEARRELQRADALVQALSSDRPEVSPPEFTDTLTLDARQTAQQLQDCHLEHRQLQLLLGRCQANASALGNEEALRKQLEDVNQRITQLEDMLAAVTLAQDTLAEAKAELQRRFAPRISQRAQEIFSLLTEGRYARITLDAELAVHTAAENETVMRSALWRSEGTIDQLYFALRLAVAEELTPNTPLILDDALVRFDDTRLAAAMSVLRETAETKQVLLFTCQSREQEAFPTT